MKRYLMFVVLVVFCFTLSSCWEGKSSRNPANIKTDEELKHQKATQIAQTDEEIQEDPAAQISHTDIKTPYPTKGGSGDIIMSDADKKLFDEGIDRIQERIREAYARYADAQAEASAADPPNYTHPVRSEQECLTSAMPYYKKAVICAELARYDYVLSLICLHLHKGDLNKAYKAHLAADRTVSYTGPGPFPNCEEACKFCWRKSGVLKCVYGGKVEELKDLFPELIGGIPACYSSHEADNRLKKCGISITNNTAYEFINNALSLCNPDCFTVAYFSRICADIVESYRSVVNVNYRVELACGPDELPWDWNLWEQECE